MSQIATKWASCIRLLRKTKWYGELRYFRKNFNQFRILKQKPDKKTRFLSEFTPECLKSVQYYEFLNPSRQWALDYQMGFLGENATI